jgi:rhodanese-related sulfurtransferase
MVLALRDGLRLVEAGSGRLDIIYADTQRQQIDWMGELPRSEAMADVMDLQKMLQVQGYRIVGDNRHAVAQQSAQRRAAMTRELGDNAGRYARVLSTVSALASPAADSRSERDLLRQLHYAPAGPLANILLLAQDAELLHWDGDVNVNFRDADSAAYLAGAWLEEFVLLKLTGGLGRPGKFSCNLQVASGDGVPNELDAMVLHRNRALLVECKTGRQSDKASDALYKLAQLRDKLCGSVGKALYLSAQEIGDDHRQRANEYRIDVLCADELSRLVPYLRDWTSR